MSLLQLINQFNQECNFTESIQTSNFIESIEIKKNNTLNFNSMALDNYINRNENKN